MSIKDFLLNTSKLIAIKTIYDKVFQRYDRPNYNETPGLINIDRCDFTRIELDIDSDGYNLKGYYYDNNSNDLIVVCHGLRSGADDYLPIINYFYKNGYDCLSFNYKGTYESEGNSTIGMSESLVDLNNVIKYIKTDNRFKNKNLYLIGHSWGGFAVAAILNFNYDIKGIASISGFNDASSVIVDIGVFYGGDFAAKPKKYIDDYQEYLFGDYLKYNAINGINKSNAKIIIAHGINDFIINYNEQSIISKIDKTNNNIITYTGYDENGSHEGILYSKEALDYQKEVKRKIKLLKINKEALYEYISKVDNYKYNELNEDLFNLILKTFRS